MRKLLIIMGLFIFTCAMAFSSSDTYVYIVEEAQSETFHYNNNCKCISNNKLDVEKITLTEAKKLGKTSCSLEL